jgi:hypothetical protein
MIFGSSTAMFLLAQSEPWRTQGPRPPRLTPGPTILDVFYEQPLLTAGVALFLGLVLLFVLLRSGRRRRAAVAAGVAVGAAVGLFLLGRFVETDREQVKRRTHELLSAVERADIIAIEEMLAPNASGAFYGRTIASPRDALVSELDRALASYPVTSARISAMEAATRLKGAAQTRTRVVIRAPEATLYDVPTRAWFLIDWRRDETGRWLATRIELEMVEGRPELANAHP